MISRKVCQPEMDSVPQNTSMPKLSSNNLIWKEVTEEASKARIVACYIMHCNNTGGLQLEGNL